MHLFACGFIFLVSLQCTQLEVTPDIYARVESLKRQLKAELSKGKTFTVRDGKLAPILDESASSNEAYEYQEFPDDGKPATPILEEDELRTNTLYNMKHIASTSQGQVTASKSFVLVPILRKEKHNNQHRVEDVFYRKSAGINYQFKKLNEYKDKHQDWVYCQAVIAPILTGAKLNVTAVPRLISDKDHLFVRFMQLLSVNTTGYTVDDVYMLLYQISSIQLRFFMWDSPAIKLLLNLIIQGSDHNLKNLKQGIKNLFARWPLDYQHNTTNLLKQSRMFRPPCVVPMMEGSTRNVHGRTLTPPQPRTKKVCDRFAQGECIDD